MRSSRNSTLAVAPQPSAAAAPAPATHTAVVTVGRRIRPRGMGHLPMLILVGEWLGRLGFRAGTYVVVRAAPGRIVIEARGHISAPGAEEDRRLLRASLRAS